MSKKISLYCNFSCLFETDIFCNLPGRAPLPFTTQENKLEGHIEVAFLSKTKDHFTRATSVENTNQLKKELGIRAILSILLLYFL